MNNRYDIVEQAVHITVFCKDVSLLAVVDVADLPKLLEKRVMWYASLARKSKTKHYVFAKFWNPISKKSRTVGIHRYLFDEPAGMDVHHEDNDGLNNRRKNLKVCEHIINMRTAQPEKDWAAYDADKERVLVFKKLVLIGNEIGAQFDLTRQGMWNIRAGKTKRSAACKAYWNRVLAELPHLFKSKAEKAMPWVAGPELIKPFWKKMKNG